MKRVTTLLAIAAMWVATIAAPATANEHVLTDEGLFDWFYESAEADLVLVTGPPFDQGCVGDGFTLVSRKSILKDGLYTSRMNVNGTELRLYEASSFEELINAACEAFFTGGDMPEPIAFGVGSWKYRAWDQTELPPSSFDAPPVGAHIASSAPMSWKWPARPIRWQFFVRRAQKSQPLLHGRSNTTGPTSCSRSSRPSVGSGGRHLTPV
jgi:hypothetical protein